MKKNFKKLLPNNMKSQIKYAGRKVGSSFQTIDQTIFEHKYDRTYYGKCPGKDYVDDCTGETVDRISERIVDYTGRVTNPIQ